MLNEAEFRELYAEAAPPLRQYAARTMGSVQLADDIVQEAFLRFLRQPARSMDRAGQRAYLFRIAGNLIVDGWRKRKREADFAATELVEASSQDSALSIEVARVFLKLRPIDRQLMWLAYVEGENHREIADSLGLREHSIRVLLFRARQKLLALLGGTPRINVKPRGAGNDVKVAQNAAAPIPFLDEHNS